MKELFLLLSLTILTFNGCTTSTASKKAQTASVEYPECVPGPYGECPNIVTNK